MNEHIESRKAWARLYIQAAPDAPVYGTAQWIAMPDGPAKVASVVKAAESWLTEQEEQLAAFDAELRFRALQAKAAEKAAEDAMWAEQRQALGRSVLVRRHPRLEIALRRDPLAEAEIRSEWARWTNGDDAA